MEEIKKNSREIADESIGDSIFVFSAEFDSVEIQPRKSFDGKENLIISKVLYTTSSLNYNLLLTI